MNNKLSSPYNELDISRIKRSSNTSPKFSRGILIAQSVKFFTKLAGADFYEFFLPQSVCRFTNIHGRSKERLERRTFPTWPPRFDSTRRGLPRCTYTRFLVVWRMRLRVGNDSTRRTLVYAMDSRARNSESESDIYYTTELLL